MTIQVNDTLPEATLLGMTESGPSPVKLSTLLARRKVVIFGLPGAYTGTCSTAHVPSFIRNKPGLEAKGVDEIICISVNDPFVLEAWGKVTGGTEAGIRFLGDSDGGFTRQIGLGFSAPAVGLIDRSQRYAMLVEDGKVRLLHVESAPGECGISSGESLLEAI